MRSRHELEILVPISDLKNTAEKLVKWARDHKVRDDWHEPDEQGLSARVVGQKLDNAFGDSGFVLDDDVDPVEMLVILRDGEGKTLRVNLASVLALAASVGS